MRVTVPAMKTYTENQPLLPTMTLHDYYNYFRDLFIFYLYTFVKQPSYYFIINRMDQVGNLYISIVISVLVYNVYV